MNYYQATRHQKRAPLSFWRGAGGEVEHGNNFSKQVIKKNNLNGRLVLILLV